MLVGDQDIAKRSENMLSMDHLLEDEFAKSLEIFNIFVSQPGEIETKIVNRIKTVIDKLTGTTKSSRLKDITHEEPKEEDRNSKKASQINKVMDHYLKVIK